MSGQQANSIFDKEIIASLYEAIGSSTGKIITIYLEDVPSNIQSMRLALESKDYETIARLAHSLKSSSGNLGATQVAELSIELEKAINTCSATPEYIALSIDKLESAFKSIQLLLSSYLN